LRAALLGSALDPWLLTAWRQEAPQDGEAWVYFPFWALLRLVWGAAVSTSLWAERVTVQNQPPDEVEALYGDAPEVDRVATTEPLPFTLGMALFNNLFIDACLKGSACWAQASSASPLLHATNVCDQPYPTIRAIDARLNGCVDQLPF
jgi:hypothetical protein